MSYKATDVFVPGGFPELTYVERTGKDYETYLGDALEMRGQIVSLAGPSKSGKTVLVEKVVGKDNLIPITGAGITDASQIWERVLNWMDVPGQQTKSSKTEGGPSFGLEGRADVGVPGLVKGQVTGRLGLQATHGIGDTQTYSRRGMQQVIDEISGSEFAILIDDFHYMTREIQDEVAKQIKEAVRQGVNVIVASVIHRSDDVVRALPELRGRVTTIDLEYWAPNDLTAIASKGFDLMNFEVDPAALDELVAEAAGSPQLMQSICYFTCLQLDARETFPIRRTFTQRDIQKARIMERTVASADFRSLVDVLDSGPKTRGVERKMYNFRDGVSGDVYRCVLKSVAADPPRLAFPYPEILERVAQVCEDEPPVGSSIVGACAQMAKLALDNFPKERAIDWDEQKQILDIPDPYLLFYLRWSQRLRMAE